MERSVNLQFNNKTYSISIPTNRQLLNIETMKSTISNGQYSRLLTVNTVAALIALDRIDMISYLTILSPDLIKDLKVSSLLDLDVLDTKKLADAFTSKVSPWIIEWQKELARIPTKESIEQETAE